MMFIHYFILHLVDVFVHFFNAFLVIVENDGGNLLVFVLLEVLHHFYEVVFVIEIVECMLG